MEIEKFLKIGINNANDLTQKDWENTLNAFNKTFPKELLWFIYNIDDIQHITILEQYERECLE